MKSAYLYHIATCGISSYIAFFQTVSIFYTTSVSNTSNFKKKAARCNNMTSCKVRIPVIRPDLVATWIFSTDFRKILKYQNFMNIRPVGAVVFRADWRDRQTDMTNLIVAFRYFANAPKDCRDRPRPTGRWALKFIFALAPTTSCSLIWSP